MSLISFWSFLAFAVNSFLFILIGMSVNWSDIWTNIGLIIITVLLLWLARAIMIFLTGKIVNHKKRELSKKWQIVMWWGGLRGAIPIAMALSIPLFLDDGITAFPHRDTILAVTFGVVLGTLLIQGLTLRPLLKGLGFYASSQKEAEQEEKEISVLLRDSMDELSTLREDDELSNKGYEILISRYSQANSQLLAELGMMINEHSLIPKDEYSFAVKEALEAKKDAVKDTWVKGVISGATGEKLMSELDEQIAILSIDEVDTPKTAVEVLRSVARPASNGNKVVLERTCGICLQSMDSEEPYCRCRCGTVFHNNCIGDIERCPICIAVLDNNYQVPAGSGPTYDLERNI
ncbi:MAG: cation:proton antiporter, partial [Thermoplasmata archaeon]|nr:cation:proton antiporter [Thermoplasmata archaeon]